MRTLLQITFATTFNTIINPEPISVSLLSPIPNCMLNSARGRDKGKSQMSNYQYVALCVSAAGSYGMLGWTIMYWLGFTLHGLSTKTSHT
jgi:hypothetical protein